jgi:hypothetical protein
MSKRDERRLSKTQLATCELLIADFINTIDPTRTSGPISI